MQIVIDIPDDIIESAKSSPNYYPTYHFEKIWKAIVNSTLLPKGHGRLIDENDLWFEDIDDISCVTQKNVENAPTIIPADKE